MWAELCIMDNTNVQDQEQTQKEGWTGLLSSQMPKQGPLKPSALSMALHGSPAYKFPKYLCTHVLWLVLGFVGWFGNCWLKVLDSCKHTITVIIGTKDSQHSLNKCLTSGIVYLQTPNREKLPCWTWLPLHWHLICKLQPIRSKLVCWSWTQEEDGRIGSSET